MPSVFRSPSALLKACGYRGPFRTLDRNLTARMDTMTDVWIVTRPIRMGSGGECPA
jgi:hypothetical protein